MRFFRPNQLNSLDARFSRVMISTWITLSLYNVLELGKYYYQILPKKYEKQIAERLYDKNLFADKIATVLYDNPSVDILVILWFIAIWLATSEFFSHRNEHRNTKKYSNVYINDVEEVLFDFLQSNWSLHWKFIILDRFSKLDADAQEKFIWKIELELWHAPVELNRESQILSNQKYIDKMAKSNFMNWLLDHEIRFLKVRLGDVDDDIQDEIAIKDNKEKLLKVLYYRIEKNKKKIQYFPELIQFLKVSKERSLHNPNIKEFSLDYLLQLLFIPEKFRPWVSFSSLSSLPQSESAQ